MKSYIFLHMLTAHYLLFICVEGFVISPHHTGRNTVRKYRSHERSTDAARSRASYSSAVGGGVLYQSHDPNQHKETPPSNTTTSDTDDVSSYDFESGFQERLKKEGGRTGMKVKAAKRSMNSAVDSAARDVKGSVTNSSLQLSDLGLLSNSEWSMTLGVLVLVVVLAVGSHFAAPPEPFAALSTSEQLERLANAEQVGFGVGAGVR
mmetsp:Transcript_21236/g.25270  ORF Transcript_21236/g.25270 Transcript_21236/m.25270 type:complete len:206 (+) Transcript_21236:72-689(+)|eukprot:CAMPEP_0198264180 /NCGR_PEP_ID=MMETSP1447-20131203/14932_1 /TAXON_ID=420782 /ORGANISM="Chaetoceros dichaeta, Strain CCMP1751" /LENGTH=205 /DNA_ID=CAMNT_0043953041 /DNA_START=66 /DNA_END=683 /DNA_ORIENTATION=+